MAWDGSEGEDVSLANASTWTENWRTEHSTLKKAHYMGRDLIDDILAQSGCVGIRVYHAIDGSDDECMVMVGVDSSENDQISAGQVIAERSLPCPSYCGGENDLNN